MEVSEVQVVTSKAADQNASDAIASGLPVHLSRYLDESLGRPRFFSSDSGLEDSMLWERHRRGLLYLQKSLKEARFSSISLDELLSCLQNLPNESDPSLIVTEVIGRWPESGQRLEGAVVQALFGMLNADENHSPKQRVTVDRALHRLVHHCTSGEAFALGIACARSTRTIRRQAAYRFYWKRGLNDEARDWFVEQYGQKRSPEFHKNVVTDGELLERIGIDRILSDTKELYWRHRAVAVLLSRDTDSALALAGQYPEELIGAIRRERRVDLVQFLLDLLAVHCEDPYLVNRILQCLIALGDQSSILQVSQAGRLLLDKVEVVS